MTTTIVPGPDWGELAADLTQVAAMPLPDLVKTYVEAKSLGKCLEKVQEVARARFLDSLPLAEKNAKNEFVFQGGMETVIARPRVKQVFLPDVATTLLDQKGLLELAQTTETIVKDPTGLVDVFESVQERLLQLGETALAAQLGAIFAATTEKRTTLDQDKIERLVEKGKLSLTDVATMHKSTTTYALY